LGDIQFLADDVNYLVFTRSHGDDTLLCAFNFSAQESLINLGATHQLNAIEGHGCTTLNGQYERLPVPAYGTVIARLAR
jgi:alpha-glucosidase